MGEAQQRRPWVVEFEGVACRLQGNSETTHLAVFVTATKERPGGDWLALNARPEGRARWHVSWGCQGSTATQRLAFNYLLQGHDWVGSHLEVEECLGTNIFCIAHADMFAIDKEGLVCG